MEKKLFLVEEGDLRERVVSLSLKIEEEPVFARDVDRFEGAPVEGGDREVQAYKFDLVQMKRVLVWGEDLLAGVNFLVEECSDVESLRTRVSSMISVVGETIYCKEVGPVGVVASFIRESFGSFFDD